MDRERLLPGVLQLALPEGIARVEAPVLRVVGLVEHVRVGRGEVVQAEAPGEGRHRQDDHGGALPPRPFGAMPGRPGRNDGFGFVVWLGEHQVGSGWRVAVDAHGQRPSIVGAGGPDGP